MRRPAQGRLEPPRLRQVGRTLPQSLRRGCPPPTSSISDCLLSCEHAFLLFQATQSGAFAWWHWRMHTPLKALLTFEGPKWHPHYMEASLIPHRGSCTPKLHACLYLLLGAVRGQSCWAVV